MRRLRRRSSPAGWSRFASDLKERTAPLGLPASRRTLAADPARWEAGGDASVRNSEEILERLGTPRGPRASRPCTSRLRVFRRLLAADQLSRQCWQAGWAPAVPVIRGRPELPSRGPSGDRSSEGRADARNDTCTLITLTLVTQFSTLRFEFRPPCRPSAAPPANRPDSAHCSNRKPPF
jgi:hypothetical protein